MKRRKLAKGVALGAALTGVTLGMNGCLLFMTQPSLYGPPPDEDSSVWQEETAPVAEEETTFDPADMEITEVYGPPVEEFDEEFPSESAEATE